MALNTVVNAEMLLLGYNSDIQPMHWWLGIYNKAFAGVFQFAAVQLTFNGA